MNGKCRSCITIHLDDAYINEQYHEREEKRMENYPNDYHMQQQNSYSAPPPKSNTTSTNGLATASLVLGILSILLTCCGFSWFFGALGIMLSLLSRGKYSMSGTAKAGMGLSIGGFVLSIIMVFVFFIGFIVSEDGRALMHAIEYGSEYYNSPEELEDYLYDYFYNDGNGSGSYNYDYPDDYDYDYDYNFDYDYDFDYDYSDDNGGNIV